MPEYKLFLPDDLCEEDLDWIISELSDEISRKIPGRYWDLEEIDI